MFNRFGDFLWISKTIFEDIFTSVCKFCRLRSFFLVVGSDLSSLQRLPGRSHDIVFSMIELCYANKL